MTKFVLHGGFNKDKGYIKDEFFQNVLQDTPAEVKIFLVFFAELEEYLGLRIEQCKGQFNNNKGIKKLEFKMASEENFLEGCVWADVIFLSGGRTVNLLESLKKYQNLEQVFSEKVIAGDSAGVNVLGHLFYSKNSKAIGEGFKLLPFKIVVHYIDGVPNPLGQIKPEMETVFLHEYETKVFSF